MSWFVAVVNRFSIFEATSKYRKQSENKYSSWWRPISASSNCVLCSDMYDYAPSLYTHKYKPYPDHWSAVEGACICIFGIDPRLQTIHVSDIQYTK